MAEQNDPGTTGTALLVDPSSTCTGWSLWTVDLHGGKFLQSGRLVGPSRFDALNRVRAMCREFHTLRINVPDITHLVVEIPSGKVHGKKRQAMQGAGLSTYGMAAGYILAYLSHATLPNLQHVVTYKDNEWTGDGRCKTYGSKAARQMVARMVSSIYDPDKDKGMDESDAIALGKYHLGKLRLDYLRAAN